MRPPPMRMPLPAPVRPECAAGQPAYRRVAFVHINKAGGTSMRMRLFVHARHQLLEVTEQPQAMTRMRELGSRFFHASASLQRQVLGKEKWEGAYTFALVRNPYARQVSMFFFLLQEASCNRPVGARPPHCEERMLPAPGPWLRDRAQSIAKFRTWIAALAKRFPSNTREAHLFGSRSHGNERDAWFNASQLSWLVDESGKVLVHDVIKLEELESSWPKLQRHICGLAHSPYASDADVRRNPSSHAHYSEYYDEPTKRLVDAYVAADLRAFGYTFERPAPPPAPQKVTLGGT
jgi:hypothetical protein